MLRGLCIFIWEKKGSKYENLRTPGHLSAIYLIKRNDADSSERQVEQEVASMFGKSGFWTSELKGGAVCFPVDVLQATVRKELYSHFLWSLTGGVYCSIPNTEGQLGPLETEAPGKNSNHPQWFVSTLPMVLSSVIFLKRTDTCVVFMGQYNDGRGRMEIIFDPLFSSQRSQQYSDSEILLGYLMQM